MVEVGKCRLEPDKDKRVAQILATDVTREQLAEVVWSMERMHATQHDLIMELMNRNAKLRELAIGQHKLTNAVYRYWAGIHTFRQFSDMMAESAKVNRLFGDLGIEVDS